MIIYAEGFPIRLLNFSVHFILAHRARPARCAYKVLKQKIAVKIILRQVRAAGILLQIFTSGQYNENKKEHYSSLICVLFHASTRMYLNKNSSTFRPSLPLPRRNQQPKNQDS